MNTSHNAKQDENGEDFSPLGSTSLADALGVNDDFAPDFMAPAVDRELIRRFVRSELDGRDREQVTDFITGFRPWRLALQDILREEAEGSGINPALPED